MEKSDLDEIVKSSARHFIEQMDINGWLGTALGGDARDISGISQEDIHTIVVRTIIRLHDEYDEEIEYMNDQDEEDEYVSEEEEVELEEIEEEEREDVDSELRKEYIESEESDKAR